MKKTLLLMLLVGCFKSLYAQEQNDSAPDPHKNDIGFNTNIILSQLFESGNQQPFTLVYKRYTSPYKALRFGISGAYSSTVNDKASTGVAGYTNGTSGDVSVAVGKEFQHAISATKWIWYYGGDLVPAYSQNSITYYQTADIKNSNAKNTDMSLSLRPFLGIRYNINSRLYVSAEASFQGGYGIQKYKREDFINDVKSDIKSHSTYASFNPATGILLFYRF